MRICVVGGGAAGCIAAGVAARSGAEVTLLEKNEKLLKKVYITGKGRCNLTNYTDAKGLMEQVVSNAKFLYGAFAGFDAFALYRFFEEELGVPLKVERGNRVFPASDKSSDITAALGRFVRDSGVKILLNTQMLSITAGAPIHVKTNRGELSCDKLIVATGGKSYPTTGSTGDGYDFAERLGHSVIAPVPSLVGIDCEEQFFPALAGLTLKNVELTCFREERRIHSDFGELLFTHTGISGPIVLSLSARINRSDLRDLTIYIDLKPALTEKELDVRIQRDFAEFCNKAFKNALGGLLPKSMIPVVVERSGIDPDKAVNRVTAEERQKLVGVLKRFSLRPKTLRGFAEAIITAGGVCVKEISPKTMESKLQENVYFAGEVLDVDALTGGFNLQIAFSTGYAAGLAASEMLAHPQSD